MPLGVSDTRGYALQRLAHVRGLGGPDEPANLLPIAQKNQRGPELHTKLPSQTAPRAVFHPHVPHFGMLGEGGLHNGCSPAAMAAPVRAEVEHRRPRPGLNGLMAWGVRGVNGWGVHGITVGAHGFTLSQNRLRRAATHSPIWPSRD